MNNLFVYGTLMNDEIQRALVGKSFEKTAAEIVGYIASDLNGRYSPGLKQKDGSRVKGFILHNIDNVSFRIIKAWENDDYELIHVEPENSNIEHCYTYLWKADILDKPWDYNYFIENHLQWCLEVDIPNFLKGCDSQHVHPSST